MAPPCATAAAAGPLPCCCCPCSSLVCRLYCFPCCRCHFCCCCCFSNAPVVLLYSIHLMSQLSEQLANAAASTYMILAHYPTCCWTILLHFFRCKPVLLLYCSLVLLLLLDEVLLLLLLLQGLYVIFTWPLCFAAKAASLFDQSCFSLLVDVVKLNDCCPAVHRPYGTVRTPPVFCSHLPRLCCFDCFFEVDHTI